MCFTFTLTVKIDEQTDRPSRETTEIPRDQTSYEYEYVPSSEQKMRSIHSPNKSLSVKVFFAYVLPILLADIPIVDP